MALNTDHQLQLPPKLGLLDNLVISVLFQCILDGRHFIRVLSLDCLDVGFHLS